MPGMAGFELYKEIRQIDGNAKVCFLTAAFETCRKEFAVLLPMLNEVKCFLKKPIAMDDLVKRLGALLEPNSSVRLADEPPAEIAVDVSYHPGIAFNHVLQPLVRVGHPYIAYVVT